MNIDKSIIVLSIFPDLLFGAETGHLGSGFMFQLCQWLNVLAMSIYVTYFLQIVNIRI